MQSLETRVPKIILQRAEEMYPPLKEGLLNSDSVKVENGMDVLSEGDSADTKSNNEVYTPLLTFPMQKAEPETISAVKLEDEVDVPKEYCFDMETDKAYIPSTFSMQKAKPKNCMDFLTVEPGSSSEACPTSSHDGNQIIDIKVEVSDTQDVEDPLLITLSEIKAEHESILHHQLIDGAEQPYLSSKSDLIVHK
ncbi:hypothetical protein B7P43_G01757, partial [Cryptotermes secundus]